MLVAKFAVLLTPNYGVMDQMQPKIACYLRP